MHYVCMYRLYRSILQIHIYHKRFRHCAVGHSSPDQFQFWLVTVLPSIYTMDTSPLRVLDPQGSAVGLRPANGDAVNRRRLCGRD